jgi:hypothetical protein
MSTVIAGNYTCTVKDATLATTTSNITLTQNPQMNVSISNIINVKCKGDLSGSLTATGLGGKTPYSYFWLTVPIQYNPIAVNLGPGIYTVGVFDSLGCYKSSISTITEPTTRLKLVQVYKVNPIYPNTNGGIIVKATDGTGPYLFNIDGGTYQSSPIFTNIPIGTHIIRAIDTNTCELSTSATFTFQIHYNLVSKGKQVVSNNKSLRLGK